MFILQHTHPRVNMQTPYRFQSFLSQYVSLLDTKSPGGRVLSGAGMQALRGCALFADHEENQSVFLLLGNGNAELGRIVNTSLFQVTLNIHS